jgi:hypothetical protein
VRLRRGELDSVERRFQCVRATLGRILASVPATLQRTVDKYF